MRVYVCASGCVRTCMYMHACMQITHVCVCIRVRMNKHRMYEMNLFCIRMHDVCDGNAGVTKIWMVRTCMRACHVLKQLCAKRCISRIRVSP